ncbi:MAG: flagellar motor switch protein FliN [Sedimenticola sp.]|uniref:Flagellar motor switch protein FliN n=1 Tax=Sedimenticola thiotaurini TaxID=1543721 RepID=A0A558D3J9_9GAMM|nr:flagellar motor switch protein FliN [Sedimenticola sp.]TVT55553.1 MAG: flagellar motor switch protein FliN [Sedimenticola thiotaurini]MCW8921724.1 flagellar motor switch protein FliN [Sedimenticola sp.]MCW8946809.1 flagellar motor switch protein FliN [Sedimenticola sp.]MCW8948892.1 flagellar motor switch protein FliN [Sedimenticola sp.]
MSDIDKDANEALADEWAAAMEEQDVVDESVIPASTIGGAESAQFQELTSESGKSGSGEVQLDAILDVPVTISMEIGRTQISIRNLLQLNQGSVVELDRLAGEPMDVLVNGTLIAKGEVVVVNEKFGIRLTDIISPADRVKRLGK